MFHGQKLPEPAGACEPASAGEALTHNRPVEATRGAEVLARPKLMPGLEVACRPDHGTLAEHPVRTQDPVRTYDAARADMRPERTDMFLHERAMRADVRPDLARTVRTHVRDLHLVRLELLYQIRLLAGM
ncbi:MAG: hypothetical protein AB7J19_17905, partial [Beijerinckiaceae bacterium]